MITVLAEPKSGIGWRFSGLGGTAAPSVPVGSGVWVWPRLEAGRDLTF